MKTLRLPLVGSFTSRSPGPALDTATQDQYFDNCVPEMEVNPLTGKPTVYTSKRNGFTSTASVGTLATGNYGITVWTGNAASTAPAILSFLKQGATSTQFFTPQGGQIGSDIPSATACTYLDETTVNGTAHLTASIVNISSYNFLYFFPEGGAWTQVTSAHLTTAAIPICPDHCHMDGYQFVMRRDAKIYNSDLNTVSSYSATNFITANSFSDNGVGIARYKNTIAAFGAFSVEFFYNAGNAAGSVLSRIANATIRIGCRTRSPLNGRVFIPLQDTIYWLGVNAETGQTGLYRLKGYTAEKVSGGTEDKMFTAASASLLMINGSFQLFGLSHIMFTIGQSIAHRLCYCVDRNFWWRFIPGNSIQVTSIVGNDQSAGGANRSCFSAVQNNEVYTFGVPATPVWTDNASSYSLVVQTGNLDAGTDLKKFWRKLRLQYDTQASASPITVKASDNDGNSFSTLGTIDTVSTNAQNWLTRLGASRRREWQFTHSTATACRIAAVQLDYDEGAS